MCICKLLPFKYNQYNFCARSCETVLSDFSSNLLRVILELACSLRVSHSAICWNVYTLLHLVCSVCLCRRCMIRSSSVFTTCFIRPCPYSQWAYLTRYGSCHIRMPPACCLLVSMVTHSQSCCMASPLCKIRSCQIYLCRCCSKFV